MFKGHDVAGSLGDPLGAPGARSLCGLIRQNCPVIAREVLEHWQAFRGAVPAATYQSVEKPFADVEGWWGTKYGDTKVIAALYGADVNTATAVLGHADADAFMTRFRRARENAFYVFFQVISANKLVLESFKSTYQHRDIEYVFQQHTGGDAHAVDTAVLSARVAETARIMFRIIWGNINGPWRGVYDTRTIVTTFLLAAMHNKLLRKAPYQRNGRFCYNQSSVAFTLLTFAYLVACAWEEQQRRYPLAYDYSEDDWYFFWKVLGSSLGVYTELMPDNHAEAGALWRTFLNDANECHLHYHQVDAQLRAAYAGVDVDPTAFASWIPAFLLTQVKNLGSWTLAPAIDRLFLAGLLEAIANGEVELA